MRTICTLAATAIALIAATNSLQAALPVDALLTMFETANPERSVVAVCDGEHIVLLPSPMLEVEVKGRAVRKEGIAYNTIGAVAAATLVGSLANTVAA